MGATKHIKRILFEKDMKIGDLADIIGKPRQTLANQLQRDSWKFAEVEGIADKMGCDIVLIDRQTGQRY